MSDLDTVIGPTNPAKPGNQTTEYALAKVLMICGLVLSIAGFAGDFISEASHLLPAGSSALRYAGIAGAVIAAVAKLAYLVSRTLIKMKLVDAQAAAAAGIPDAPPGDAAAAVLGADAPQGNKS